MHACMCSVWTASGRSGEHRESAGNVRHVAGVRQHRGVDAPPECQAARPPALARGVRARSCAPVPVVRVLPERLCVGLSFTAQSDGGAGACAASESAAANGVSALMAAWIFHCCLVCLLTPHARASRGRCHARSRWRRGSVRGRGASGLDPRSRSTSRRWPLAARPRS